ncbi:DUF222 domain-containing protein, partial [Knoellia remsis]|uniref:DUF222 domain-containing protein n=1 Tax=Knoellia remsis TaxID=407159 RepID=UPI001FE314DA
QGRCAALAEAASTLTSDELLDLAERFQREIDTAVALRTIALAHLSAREPRLLEDGTEVEEHRGLGHQRMDAPELAAPRLGVSVHKATQLIMTAVDQLTRTPQVVTALASGELNEAKASAVTHETMFLPADSAREVADRAADHWADLTVGPLRTRVATIAAQVDPDAVAAHVNDTRSRRGLTRRTGSDGTDHWRADLLTEHARPAWAAVTERALQIRRDGDADTMEQARADALTQLILEHSDVTVVIHATRAAEPTTPAPEQPDASGEANAGADSATPRPATADAESESSQPATGAESESSQPIVDTESATPRPGTVADAESESSQPALGAAPALQTTVSCPNGHDITAQHLVGEHLAATDRATIDTATAGHDDTDGLVEVGGFGAPGTTFVPAAFLAGATTAACDDPAAQLTCHPDTGALISGYVPVSLAPTRTRNATSSDAESSAYRVPAAMARLVRLRDGTCRFPGCTASARQTDLDHVIPWPQGPTHPGNLIALCRHHHRIKQRHDWRVRLDPDGTATWT